MSEQGEAGRRRRLTARYVRVGTDAAHGEPYLQLSVGSAGFDAPDQLYLIEPETARMMGEALLMASTGKEPAPLSEVVEKLHGVLRTLDEVQLELLRSRPAHRTTEPDDAPRQRFVTAEEMARIHNGEAVFDAKPARSLDPQLIDEINRGLHQGNIEPRSPADPAAYAATIILAGDSGVVTEDNGVTFRPLTPTEAKLAERLQEAEGLGRANLQPGSISDPEAYERAIKRGDLVPVGRVRPTLAKQLLDAASDVLSTLMAGGTVSLDQLSALDEAVFDMKRWQSSRPEAS